MRERERKRIDKRGGEEYKTDEYFIFFPPPVRIDKFVDRQIVPRSKEAPP